MVPDVTIDLWRLVDAESSQPLLTSCVLVSFATHTQRVARIAWPSSVAVYVAVSPTKALVGPWSRKLRRGMTWIDFDFHAPFVIAVSLTVIALSARTWQ